MHTREYYFRRISRITQIKWLVLIFVLFSQPLMASTLAVTKFHNLSNEVYLSPLERSIPAMLTTDLSNADGIVIVERKEIEHIIGEQKFSLSGMVEERGEKEVGRLIGVDFILNGSYALYGNLLRIDVKVTNVSTGVIRGFSQMGIDENVVHQLSESVAQHLLDKKISLNVDTPVVIIPEKPVVIQPWYKKWYTWAIAGTVIAGVILAVGGGANGGDGGKGGLEFNW